MVGRRGKIVVLLELVVLYLVPACSSESERPPSEYASHASGTPHASVAELRQGGGRLVIGMYQEPERLSEILNGTASNNYICNLIFSKFVKYDDQLRLIPDLIEDIPTVENGGVSPDHLTYRYRLKKGVRWHDGVPLTSRDVRFTVEVITNPAITVESREGWDVIETVETPDDYTVIFHLNRPYPDFVSETFYDESILPMHQLVDARGRDFRLSPFHRAPVGSGPFVFKEWASGSHLILTRNDSYYDEGPYLDEIVIKFVPNEQALFAQLRTGEIDVFDNANVALVEQARELPEIRSFPMPSLMYEHLDLNTENPILADWRVRQALSYATDRSGIVRDVYRGFGTIAKLDEHPSSAYYSPKAAAKAVYDPARSRRLLHEAGWVDNDGDGILEKEGRELQLTITATAGNEDREKTELILQKLYKEVGVDLKIRNYVSTVLYGSYEDGGILKRGKFDIALYAWLSSPEPATKASLYGLDNIPPRGQNNPRFRHERLSELLEEGAREFDRDRRIRIYHEVAEILVTEVPVIPLFWYTTVDLCREGVESYRPNPSQSADTWNANRWYRRETASITLNEAP